MTTQMGVVRTAPFVCGRCACRPGTAIQPRPRRIDRVRANPRAVDLRDIPVDDRSKSCDVLGKGEGREQREDESKAFHADSITHYLGCCYLWIRIAGANFDYLDLHSLLNVCEQGAAISLDPASKGNDVNLNWCAATTPLPNGDFGSPGVQNPDCP